MPENKIKPVALCRRCKKADPIEGRQICQRCLGILKKSKEKIMEKVKKGSL